MVVATHVRVDPSPSLGGYRMTIADRPARGLERNLRVGKKPLGYGAVAVDAS